MNYEDLLMEADEAGLTVKEKPLASHDGRIKGRPLLFAIGGGKIDGDVRIGKTITAVIASGSDTLLCFTHCHVGEPHKVKALQIILLVTLYRYGKAVYTAQSRTEC